MSPSKQFNFAAGVGRAADRDDRGRGSGIGAAAAHLAGSGQEMDAAGTVATKVLMHQGNAFLNQKAAGKGRVDRADLLHPDVQVGTPIEACLEA